MDEPKNNNEPKTIWHRVTWGLRDIVFASLAALALVLLGGLLGLFVLVILAFVMGFDPLQTEQQHLLVLAVFALEALLILPAWWWGPRKYEGGLDLLGFRSAPWVRSLWMTGLGLALILGINILWGFVMEWFNLPGQPELVPLFGEGITGLVVALATAGIVAPIAEEVFFRGFIYAGLRQRWGITAGIVVSSVLFGLIHLTSGVILPIILMGVIFAWLYERTGSIWPPIILHGIVNALAVFGAYLASG